MTVLEVSWEDLGVRVWRGDQGSPKKAVVESEMFGVSIYQ